MPNPDRSISVAPVLKPTITPQGSRRVQWDSSEKPKRKSPAKTSEPVEKLLRDLFITSVLGAESSIFGWFGPGSGVESQEVWKRLGRLTETATVWFLLEVS